MGCGVWKGGLLEVVEVKVAFEVRIADSDGGFGRSDYDHDLTSVQRLSYMNHSILVIDD